VREALTRVVAVLVDIGVEFRAGRSDARRTPRPRPLAGRKWGNTFYALGYMVSAINSKRRRSSW
jgi:hypothetical protein